MAVTGKEVLIVHCIPLWLVGYLAAALYAFLLAGQFLGWKWYNKIGERQETINGLSWVHGIWACSCAAGCGERIIHCEARLRFGPLTFSWRARFFLKGHGKCLR